MNYLWFVRNPVKIGMFFLALVLMGILSWRRLPLNLFPDIQTPRITVVAKTKDLAPEEAERRLTAEFEGKLSSIKGVAGVTSYSREAHLVIHIDFHWGQDMEFAYLDVKKNIGTLEAEERVEKVDVYRFDPNSASLMTLAFSARNVDRVEATNLIENTLRTRLETIQGVAYVKANGASFQEVVVRVDEDIMAQYNLTSEQVMQAIRQASISTAGGVISEGNEEMTLKFVSRFKNLTDIRRCVITVIGGHPIHLEDLGPVEIGETRDEVYVHQDGRRTVSLDVFREPDANAVLTARRVREAVDDLNKRGGYELKIAVDQAQEIEAAIKELIRTAMIGMLLAMGVLLIFLRNIFATVIVAAAIPLSIVATFNLMYFQGLSMNIMTLGGLALGAGMLVDNGIVVIENIFRLRQEGASPIDATVRGAGGVAQAIIAATLTTVVVFAPLVYVHGIAGILFKDQALTVVYSLLMSLLVALILIPMLAARLGAGRVRPPSIINRLYGNFLTVSMKLRWVLLAILTLLLYVSWQGLQRIPTRFFPESISGQLTMALELPMGSQLQQTERVVERLESVLEKVRYRSRLMQNPDDDAALDLIPLTQTYERWLVTGDTREFFAAAGAELERLSDKHPAHPSVLALRDLFFPAKWRGRMNELLAAEDDESKTAKQLDKMLKRIADAIEPEILIRSVNSVIGMDPDSIQVAEDKIFGPHTARIEVVLNPRMLRQLSAADVANRLRTEAAKLPELTYSFESKSEFLRRLLGKNRGDLTLEVHAETLESLEEAALSVADQLLSIKGPDGADGLTNVRVNLVYGEDKYVLEPNLDAMHRGGFTIDDLAKQIQAYLRGEESDRLKLEQGEMTITIKNSRAETAGLDGLLRLPIISSEQKKESLENLVLLHNERGLQEVMRVNQERTLLVMADLESLSYQQALAAAQERLDAMPWPVGASWNVSGEEVQRRESFDRLFFALLIALVLVYMVIASILESVVHPLTIMLSAPLALVGVVVAFLWLDMDLNLMGYIGVVMLAGIVVNNAIVLLDRIRQVRQQGRAPFDAVVEAGRQRLRPIIMTSLTTILALAPLAMGFGQGAELRRPMAIAVIGGLTSSTLLTLWLLPGLYLCIEDVLGALRKILRLPGARRAVPAAAAAGAAINVTDTPNPQSSSNPHSAPDSPEPDSEE